MWATYIKTSRIILSLLVLLAFVQIEMNQSNTVKQAKNTSTSIAHQGICMLKTKKIVLPWHKKQAKSSYRQQQTIENEEAIIYPTSISSLSQSIVIITIIIGFGVFLFLRLTNSLKPKNTAFSSQVGNERVKKSFFTEKYQQLFTSVTLLLQKKPKPLQITLENNKPKYFEITGKHRIEKKVPRIYSKDVMVTGVDCEVKQLNIKSTFVNMWGQNQNEYFVLEFDKIDKDKLHKIFKHFNICNTDTQPTRSQRESSQQKVEAYDKEKTNDTQEPQNISITKKNLLGQLKQIKEQATEEKFIASIEETIVQCIKYKKGKSSISETYKNLSEKEIGEIKAFYITQIKKLIETRKVREFKAANIRTLLTQVQGTTEQLTKALQLSKYVSLEKVLEEQKKKLEAAKDSIIILLGFIKYQKTEESTCTYNKQKKYTKVVASYQFSFYRLMKYLPSGKKSKQVEGNPTSIQV